MKVAVVTGASSGFGESLARKLAARGWTCVLLARREDRLRALAEEIGAEWEVCDVADLAAVDAVAARVLERHPAVHLLVNNAGVPARAGFLDAEPERIEAAVRINYLGSVWCLRAFLPGLQAGAPSDVVNVVSVAGVVAIGPYSASKHAQLAFSRTTAAELRPLGIRVHTVKPGYAETESFPQGHLPAPVRRIVLTADQVADHILHSLDRGSGETTVPWFYAPAGWVQALFPNLLARALASRRARPRIGGR
ncbi:MAG: SDR family NAD(P)-dependent oxidoreductase [Actinobacteria bacterium]|nr:SDR family NAD(P)-dependent oxidoreductase [Actinomycetota bacterium]